MKATEVILPDGLTELEPNSFLRAHVLRKVQLPSTMKIIGNYAFHFCGSLQKIEIPNNVEYLGLGAFYGCEALEEITLNGSFNWSQEWIDCSPPFGYMKSIKKFVSNNANFAVIDGMLFSSDKKILFRCPVNKRNVSLPQEIQYISDYAFYNCRYLEKIDIPDSVTYIGKDAFGSCESLREIKLPDVLEKICNDTFSLCRQLAYIQFPYSLSSIGKDAFFGCSKLEFFHYPPQKDETIKEMMDNSGFEPVVHSPLDYTEIAQSLKWMIEFEDYDQIKELLAGNCHLILLGEETYIDNNAIIAYFQKTFHKSNGDIPSYKIKISLSEAYHRDCLDVEMHCPEYYHLSIVFTLDNNGKIYQIICGSINIHSRNSSKHPVENIMKCIKKDPISPLANQMPCMKCGLPSEKLLWLNYSAGCRMGGYKGIMSFCPNCKEEIQYTESLHYHC